MRKPIAALAALLALSIPLDARADTGVVATIKPLHSLVAGVMEGVGEPDLLIPGNLSPHSFSLKPSDARSLERARVVFWIGPDLESALKRPLTTLSGGATVQSMMNVPSITHRSFSEGHDHESGHKDEHKDEHKDDRAGHHHGADDAHIWLDPDNARVMVSAIAATLSDAMPDHAAAFAANAARIDSELVTLAQEVSTILEPVWFKPFLTFHDAFGHFEARFGLASGEAISVNPEIKPGARRIAELREEIEEEGFACVFIEPQFDPAIAEVIVEGTDTKIATLDPLGSALEEGPALYPSLIRGIATTLRDCMAD